MISEQNTYLLKLILIYYIIFSLINQLTFSRGNKTACVLICQGKRKKFMMVVIGRNKSFNKKTHLFFTSDLPQYTILWCLF